MAFFPACSGFVINGGNYFNFQTEDACRSIQIIDDSKARKRKDLERDDCQSDRKRRRCNSSSISDGLMIVEAGDIELRRELINDNNNNYRIHAASHGGRLVAIKTFEGHRANEEWEVNVAFSKEAFHPNVLQSVGISDERSKHHFILFQGITSEQKMQWSIANALGKDLNASVQLSMKAVKGIAAGLNYIKAEQIPILRAGTTNNDQKWHNFDILTGYDNEPVIAFHLSSFISEDNSVSQNFDIKTEERGIEVLNGLVRQLFSGANSLIYDDLPEREFDTYDCEGPTTYLEHEEGTLNLSENGGTSNPSNAMEQSKPLRKPRREVWWVDQRATNQSLKSIWRCFEDRLSRSLLSSSNPRLLRHIRSPKDNVYRRNIHQCPGYLRQEITLTCDVSKSVIVSHAFPGQNELCSICHQLVQYTYSEPFDHVNGFTSESQRSQMSGGSLSSDPRGRSGMDILSSYIAVQDRTNDFQFTLMANVSTPPFNSPHTALSLEQIQNLKRAFANIPAPDLAALQNVGRAIASERHRSQFSSDPRLAVNGANMNMQGPPGANMKMSPQMQRAMSSTSFQKPTLGVNRTEGQLNGGSTIAATSVLGNPMSNSPRSPTANDARTPPAKWGSC